MRFVVGIGGGDAGEQVLVAFARKQVAVAQRFLAELGQQIVAGRVGFDVEPLGIDGLAVALGFGDRNVVGAYFARGRKIHCSSPSIRPFDDGLFCFCSTRCHGSEPSLNSSAAGLFHCSFPDIHRARAGAYGR